MWPENASWPRKLALTVTWSWIFWGRFERALTALGRTRTVVKRRAQLQSV